MKILLTGKDGQIGWELRRTLSVLGELCSLDHSDVDLASADAIRAVLRDTRPDVVVNAAAYTAVDRAETEEPLALRINGIAPGVMAEETARSGALLVHYSTDYVFAGTSKVPYTEDMPPGPLNAYGRTKLAGEQAISAVGGRWIVLRTSWVYAARGNNFLLTILRLAKERDRLRIVNDQIGAPTWSRTIAEATAQIIGQSLAPDGKQANALPTGIYNLCSSGYTSWFGFAKAIVEHAQPALVPRRPSLESIPSDEYPATATRPKNSRLALDKISSTFGLTMPTWQDALDLCLDEMVARQ